MANTIDMGFKLEMLRRRSKMTQSNFAAKSGLKQAHISNIESGSRTQLSFTTVVALARGLQMEPMVLARELGFDVPTPDAESLDMAHKFAAMPMQMKVAVRTIIESAHFNLPMKAAIA